MLKVLIVVKTNIARFWLNKKMYFEIYPYLELQSFFNKAPYFPDQ